jgi:hypothetical protein
MLEIGKKNTGPQGFVAYRHRRPKTISSLLGSTQLKVDCAVL